MTSNSSDDNVLENKDQEKELEQLEKMQEGDSKSIIEEANPSTEQGSMPNENIIRDRTLNNDRGGEKLKEESTVAVAAAAAASASDGSKVDKSNVDEAEVGGVPKSSQVQLTPSSHLRPSRRAREGSLSSSMGLRRLPVDILLQPTSEFEALSDGELDESEEDQAPPQDGTASSGHRKSNAQSPGAGQSKSMIAYWSWRIHDLFLSPKYPLKLQLMLSFGSVNFCTTALVIISCILVSYYVGDSVKKINQKAFENQLVPGIQAKTVRYLAESLEQQFMPFDLVDIIEEAFQDRFQGYPNSLLGEDDSVPFRDILTGRNIYPIVGHPMFLDWQVPADVTQDNYLEHVTTRQRWEQILSKQPAVSTKSAVFYYQGSSCDPNATDSVNDLMYWPNCTAANHNIAAGGAIHPVPTLGPIYRATSDIIPLFKAIFEVNPDIRDVGVYFASMGAGAAFHYPAYPRTIKGSYYTSVGCDWMAAPNPMNPSLGPIGTPEEISRCREEGESVPSILYNPLERGWCRDQALNPHKTQVDAVVDAFNGQEWVLSVGRALYDRQTKAFVSCIMIAMSLASVEDKLRESLVTNHSALSLVLFDVNGTVIKSTASPRSSGSNDRSLPTIDQLGVGLSKASYQELYTMVQSALELGFDEQWDPETVKAKLASINVGDKDKYLVAVSPIPQVPENYDREYQPELLVVMSTSTEDVFEGVRKLDEAVDQDVKNIIWYSLIVGAVGLGFATFMIILMTRTLTAPLRFINDSADGIVEGFGHTRVSEDDCAVDDGRSGDCDDDDDDDDDGKSVNKMEEAPTKTGDKAATKKAFAGSICSPKTELNDVLQEFNVMMANFSGSKMAKSEKGRRVEVRNSFSLRAEFKDLYLSRKSPDFAYNHDLVVDAEGNETRSSQGEDYVDEQATRGLIHLGSNIEQPFKSKSKSEKTKKDKSENKRRKQFSSRLFLWTVALIATPLLLTTILIAAVVMYSMTTGFGASLEDAKAYFIKVKLDALSVHVSLRAEIVGRLTGVQVRDAYLMTRYFGWLLFGGLRRADSYTEILSAAEPCKFYAAENVSECPYYQKHYACDCAWNETTGAPCQEYPEGSSRQWQKVGVSVESRDSLLDGDRYTTSFPKVAASPETTEWWQDLTTLPGSERNTSAAGHDFLYDRMRVSSAMPLFPVLYNYDRDKVNFLGQYIAFEADGLFLGYYGCGILGSESSSWQSTEANGASKLRPELCPLGKFGYDPRCRGWYDTGRKLAIERNTLMYITAPYVFQGGIVGQSVTLPLIDPRSGEYVGQVLNDYYSNTIFEALANKSTALSEGGFPVLVAVQGKPEENIVLGPGYKTGDNASEVSRVVLRRDYDCNSAMCDDRILAFSAIVVAMNAGESGRAYFTRESPNGGEELVHISYAPVKVEGIHSLDSSDFGRGVEVTEYIIYSLGLCETEDGLLQPFKKIKRDIASAIRWAVGCIATGIFFGALFVIYMSYRVTMSITEPMLNLLEMIRCINRADFDGEPPKINHSKGSKEITKVSDTVLVLYKIVRAANDVFFAGELDLAYAVLVDALKVFKQLGNKKAIAVASNNLGNVMLSMYIEMKSLGLRKRCGLTRKEIVAKGTGHFHQAITLGEKAYDEFYVSEGWTPNCLDFMQHLSNRYFNRALFLLTVKDDTRKPEDIVKLGVRDLEISRDMFLEIISYGEDVGFNRENRAHKQFQIFLNRSRGHNMLLEMGYPDEVMAAKGYPDDWELGEGLDEAFKLLRIENQRESSELFKEVNVLGRLQDIEGAIMKYKQLTGDLDTAARIAIRMLYEDAFIFAEAISMAVDILLEYANKMELEETTRARVKEGLLNFSKNLDQDLETLDGGETRVSTLANTLDSLSESITARISTCVVEGSSSLAGLPGSSKMKSNWVTKLFSGGLVTMEDF